MDIFSNEALDIGKLPRAEDVSLKPVEPDYWKVLRFGWLIFATILITALSLFLLFRYPGNSYLLLFIPGLIIVLLLLLWIMRKSFLWKAYAIREKDIIYRSGWLIRKIAVCPFNRVQHCSVNAGPLERKLGLASLSIYVAGTEGADFKIPGLKEERALSLRDFILAKTTLDEPTGN